MNKNHDPEEKCQKHDAFISYYCIDPNCIKNNTYSLCQFCYDFHPNEHKPHSISRIYSKSLADEIKILINQQKNKVNLKISALNDIFDKLICEVNKIIEYCQDRIKQEYENKTQITQLLQLELEFSSKFALFDTRQINTKEYLFIYSKIHLQLKNIWEMLAQSKFEEITNVEKDIQNKLHQFIDRAKNFTESFKQNNLLEPKTVDTNIQEELEIALIEQSESKNLAKIVSNKDIMTSNTNTMPKKIFQKRSNWNIDPENECLKDNNMNKKLDQIVGLNDKIMSIKSCYENEEEPLFTICECENVEELNLQQKQIQNIKNYDNSPNDHETNFSKKKYEKELFGKSLKIDNTTEKIAKAPDIQNSLTKSDQDIILLDKKAEYPTGILVNEMDEEKNDLMIKDECMDTINSIRSELAKCKEHNKLDFFQLMNKRSKLLNKTTKIPEICQSTIINEHKLKEKTEASILLHEVEKTNAQGSLSSSILSEIDSTKGFDPSHMNDSEFQLDKKIWVSDKGKKSPVVVNKVDDTTAKFLSNSQHMNIQGALLKSVNQFSLLQPDYSTLTNSFTSMAFMNSLPELAKQIQTFSGQFGFDNLQLLSGKIPKTILNEPKKEEKPQMSKLKKFYPEDNFSSTLGLIIGDYQRKSNAVYSYIPEDISPSITTEIHPKYDNFAVFLLKKDKNPYLLKWYLLDTCFRTITKYKLKEILTNEKVASSILERVNCLEKRYWIHSLSLRQDEEKKLDDRLSEYVHERIKITHLMYMFVSSLEKNWFDYAATIRSLTKLEKDPKRNFMVLARDITIRVIFAIVFEVENMLCVKKATRTDLIQEIIDNLIALTKGFLKNNDEATIHLYSDQISQVLNDILKNQKCSQHVINILMYADNLIKKPGHSLKYIENLVKGYSPKGLEEELLKIKKDIMSTWFELDENSPSNIFRKTYERFKTNFKVSDDLCEQLLKNKKVIKYNERCNLGFIYKQYLSKIHSKYKGIVLGIIVQKLSFLIALFSEEKF